MRQSIQKIKREYLNEIFYFRIVKYLFCAFYILLMITANLIGFGMGSESYLIIIKKLIK